MEFLSYFSLLSSTLFRFYFLINGKKVLVLMLLLLPLCSLLCWADSKFTCLGLCSPSYVHFGWKMGHLSVHQHFLDKLSIELGLNQGEKTRITWSLVVCVHTYLYAWICFIRGMKKTRGAQSMQAIFILHLCCVVLDASELLLIVKFPLRLEGLLMSKLLQEWWTGSVWWGACWFYSSELVCVLFILQSINLKSK